MKKIRRNLRLGSLKFYRRAHYIRHAGMPGHFSNLVYYCCDRKHNLNQIMKKKGFGTGQRLIGQDLHDILCAYRDGILTDPIYLYSADTDSFTGFKKLNDLVYASHGLKLLKALAGL